MSRPLVAAIERAAGQTIIFEIDSIGGEVDSGMEIYHALAAHRCHVVAEIREASSMAATITMAADERRIAPGGTMMVHRCRAECEGNAEQFAAKARYLAEHDHNAAAITAAGIGCDVTDVAAWKAAETTFNAEESLVAGLVHRIDTGATPLDDGMCLGAISGAPIGG